MDKYIQKLPEEIENEIRDFTFTTSLRLQLLLSKYPLNDMDIFFADFTKEQLDRVYRYGCVSKVLKWNDGYTWNATHVYELLQKDERSFRIFTYSCWPVSGFNYYWETQNKKRQPSKPEYIRRITRFCTFVLAFSQHNPLPNEKFLHFCEKLVYDVIIGSLIISREPKFYSRKLK
jgi:hypothetical protein